MGSKARNHDEQVDEEIDANASIAEIEDQLVELDLDTGEAVPVEVAEPSHVFKIIGWLGSVFSSFAEKHSNSPTSIDLALAKYESRVSGLKVMFWVSLLTLAGAAELVLPFLGALILAAYFFYFSLINLTGEQSVVHKLRQAVLYGKLDKAEAAEAGKEEPGQGQYL